MWSQKTMHRLIELIEKKESPMSICCWIFWVFVFLKKKNLIWNGLKKKQKISPNPSLKTKIVYKVEIKRIIFEMV